MKGNGEVVEKDYLLLKDLKVVLDDLEVENGNGGLILCFWLYLGDNIFSTVLPATILHQMNQNMESSIPLLLLNEKGRLVLFPVDLVHEEAPKHDSPSRLSSIPSISTPWAIPVKKWVHVGCEVSVDFIRLYVGGDFVGEKSLTSSCKTELQSNNCETMALPVIVGGGGMQDYVYNVEVLPLNTDLKDHYAKEPPLTLKPLGSNDVALDNIPSIVHEARPSPLSKRVKLGNEKMCNGDATLKQANLGTNSPSCKNAQDYKAKGITLEGRPETNDTGESSLDSENSEVTNSVLRSVPDNPTLVSDITVFKYCLGGLTERSHMLKEMAISGNEHDILKFGEQVSLFSGCSHHRHQIIMASNLIEEEIKSWNLISQNNQHVLWENLVAGIKGHFINIVALSSSRPFTKQDFDFFRRLAGCQDLVSQENFEKLWRWLYPVAVTLSHDSINCTWNSVSPKWIEGFITKEEAEASLQCPGGLEAPGTFIVRFPTSRSWPHPDAGNLVVTYVGRDYKIHHRLLSHDLIHSTHDNRVRKKPLHELLLQVPELSKLGRVLR